MIHADNIRDWYLRGIDSELLTVRGKLLIVRGEPTSRCAWDVAKHYLEIIGGDVDDLSFHTAFKIPYCFRTESRDAIIISRNYRTQPPDHDALRKMTDEELMLAIENITRSLCYCACEEIDIKYELAQSLCYCTHLIQLRQNKSRETSRK